MTHKECSRPELTTLKAISELIEKVLVVAFLSIIALNFLQITMRSLFGAPFSWSEEYMRFVMIGICLIGQIVLICENDHIVAFNYSKNNILTMIAKILTRLGVLVVGAVMAWEGILVASANGRQYAPASAISMVIPYSFIPIAGCLIVLAVFLGIRRIKGNYAL